MVKCERCISDSRHSSNYLFHSILSLFYSNLRQLALSNPLGILERPPLSSSIEEVTYKIFLVGRSGVGKTSVVACLAGLLEPSNYTETNGIKKTNVFWPVKVWDKVVLFKLQFWDTSETSIKKYNHILPVRIIL